MSWLTERLLLRKVLRWVGLARNDGAHCALEPPWGMPSVFGICRGHPQLYTDPVTAYYHYTTLDVLQKILEPPARRAPLAEIQGANGPFRKEPGSLPMDGCLRLSNIRFMNDHGEFEAMTSILTAFESSKYRDDDRLDIARLNGGLKEKLSGRDTYVGSFCRKPNKLSQWRGYADGPNGVCIGLKVAAEALVYREFDANKEIEKTLCDKQLSPTDRTSNLLKAAAYLKHPDFEEEEEFRLLTFEEEPSGYYSGKHGMTPYFNHYFKPDKLTEIYLSPLSDERTAEQGMKEYLSHLQLNDVTVQRSGTSLR